jgi:hypothetical protein
MSETFLSSTNLDEGSHSDHVDSPQRQDNVLCQAEYPFTFTLTLTPPSPELPSYSELHRSFESDVDDSQASPKRSHAYLKEVDSDEPQSKRFCNSQDYLAIPESEVDWEAKFLSNFPVAYSPLRGSNRQGTTAPGSKTVASGPVPELDTVAAPWVNNSLFDSSSFLFDTPNLEIEVARPQFPEIEHVVLEGYQRLLESFPIQPSASVSCNSEFLEIALPTDTTQSSTFDLSWIVESFGGRR